MAGAEAQRLRGAVRLGPLGGEARARTFGDEELQDRALVLEEEAFRIEADRPSPDPAKTMLALAERARSRHVPEPEPSALAHRGFRRLFSEAKSAQACEGLCSRIEAFFPKAAVPLAQPSDLGRWETPYANDPAEAYRMAPPAVRQTLDHRLWADTAQRSLELRAAEDPAGALTVAEKAESRLPDRPDLALRLLELGLKSATAELTKLRRAEVESLARVYREKLRATRNRGKDLVTGKAGSMRTGSVRSEGPMPRDD